jgi:predicted RNA-binding protein (virulence factor B family)
MPREYDAFDTHLGRLATLSIQRFGPAGAFLRSPEARASSDPPTLLLLGPEIPKGAREGDTVSVFVYLDSEGRPLATTKVPLLTLGEVAFLRITACTHFGAFADWGLPKELLLPLAEQTREVRVGDRHPIGLYIDDTGRLAGTMRVSELLNQAQLGFEQDQWLAGEAWRNDPEIGLFVILEKRGVGLVPRHEPHQLTRGEAARFRVTNVLPDGKVELSLRAHAHEEQQGDAQRVLGLLMRADTPAFGDHSAPEQIRAWFGLSKKAFKRAVGHLLKEGKVTLDRDGHVRPKTGHQAVGR